MAMALLKDRVSEAAEDWRIESAGTWTVKGEPAALKTRQVLLAKGIALDEHRSRPVTRELLQEFRLILTMEAGQREALCVEFPEIAPRVHTLGELVGEAHDILDPMGGPLSGFEAMAGEIERVFDLGFEEIQRLSQE